MRMTARANGTDLTGRVSGLRSHGGMALPGGRIDAGETAVAAALRELSRRSDSNWRRAKSSGCSTTIRRAPAISLRRGGLGGQHAPLRLNPQEVASVRRFRLADIARDDAVEFDTIPESERRVVRCTSRVAPSTRDGGTDLPVSRSAGRRQTRVVDLEQPVFAWR